MNGRQLAIASLTLGGAVVIVVAGGGQAVWLCLPVLLAAAALTDSREGAVLAGAVVVAGATGPSLTGLAGPGPSLALLVLTASASLVVLVSVRERLARERDALRESALTDPLTGIANRRRLLERAEYEIARHARTGRSFAVVMLDLDGFKSLNDRFGHAAGDDLLRDVAAAVQRAMRAQDTVARLGGDEFCVLAPETDGPGARRLTSRVSQAVGEVTAGVEAVRTSLGVALYPDEGRTAAELLESADRLLLGHKRSRQVRRAA